MYESILTPLLQGAAEGITGALVSKEITKNKKRESRSLRHELDFQTQRTLSSLETHLNFVEFWASRIELLGMPAPKNLNDIYVELSLSDDPRGGRLGHAKEVAYRIEDVLEKRGNSVILGDLGSGKTTTLKKIAEETLKWFRETSTPHLPIAIRLRDFKAGQTLFQHLKSVLGVVFVEKDPPVAGIQKVVFGDTQIRVLGDGTQFEPFRVAEARGLSEFLDHLGAVVLVDGFDELDVSSRETLLDELDLLGPNLKRGQIILSSRSADFYRKPAGFSVFEICSLNEPQVRKLVSLWFSSGKQRRHTETDFFEALKKVPYSDLCKRPLALANLCLVFDKYGALPDLPITVYRKITNLLLEEWDAERGVVRESMYAFFDPQRKMDFLAAFAYRLVSRKGSALSFTASELIEIYLSVCKRFGLPQEDASKVCREIESHTGIIVKASYDTYEFSHKSLQEYLVAEHLTRLRDIPSAVTLLRNCPNELAVAVALSSDPTDWFCGLFRFKGSGFEPTRIHSCPKQVFAES